jgi:Na+-driven multidrug efflux pump
MLTLVYALAMGLGIGTTAVVARRIGEKDREGAATAAVQAILLGILGAAVIGSLGVAFAPRLLALMGASADVLRIGSGYTRVMLGGEATIVSSSWRTRSSAERATRPSPCASSGSPMPSTSCSDRA